MSIKEQRAAAIQAAKDIVAKANAEDRTVTDDEASEVETHLKSVRDLDTKAADAARSADLLKQIGEIGSPDEETPVGATQGKDLADHFVKSDAYTRMKSAKGDRFTVSAPEFKAASDPNLVGELGRTQYGRVVETALRRPTIASLFSSGSMSGSSLTYWTQGAVEGDFATVAEGGAKPPLHFNFAQVVEAPSKIAGRTKISDEMAEDGPYLESVIRSQLLLRLALAEEAQLLSGDGTGPNLTGVLERVGVQTEAAADNTDNLDAIFRAMTKVQDISQLTADGIVMNPVDYQTARLSKDGNDQYYGGGPFTGAYGNDGLALQPGVWGQRTVVTSAISAGTVLVGAFAAGGQVFRKGGVRVESTNSNEDDFNNNLISIRAEERLALAVYIPTAFVIVTLSSTEPPA